MERIELSFGPWLNQAAGKPQSRHAIAGVVGSGNLEVMLEARDLGGRMDVVVDTSISGFEPTWNAVLNDFAQRNQFADVVVTINDAGATPAVVALRLAQVSSQWRSL